jgi:hypothetical protein
VRSTIRSLEQAKVVLAYERSSAMRRGISVWRGTSKRSMACWTVMRELLNRTTENELLGLRIADHDGIVMSTRMSISINI